MNAHIYKTTAEIIPGRPWGIPGTPRTLGHDVEGRLCIWFESGPQTMAVMHFTGDELTPGYRIIDSCVWNDLVWHLCVELGA